MKKAARFVSLLLLMLLTFNLCACRVRKETELIPVTLPSDRVKSLDDLGLNPRTVLRSAVKPATYEGNKGLTHSGIFVSPDCKLKINGKDIPVYSTLAYVATGEKGAFQSFAYVDVKAKDLNKLNLTVEIEAQGFKFKEFKVFPLSSGVTAACDGVKAISKIDSLGNYTFVSGGSAGLRQEHSLLLCLREYRNEEKEIEDYKALYGEENVLVFEPGTHFLDYIHVKNSNSVVYFKRGSLIVANHNFDMRSAEDEDLFSEEGASSSNGFGLTRYPFITSNYCDNVKLVGSGIIDFSALDWHERKGIMASNGKNITFEGLTLVNAPEWSLTTYVCSGVKIKGCVVFGYRTNSDAFAVCNTENGNISHCFARTGDDAFEVKTLGSSDLGKDTTETVCFENCIAWGSKARAFGVIAEVEQDIKNIVFKNSSVIFRDAVWDNTCLGSLVVIVSTDGGNVSDITFENIDVYHDEGRAVNVSNLSKNGKNNIENIVFKNIIYSSEMKNLCGNSEQGNGIISVTFNNVLSDGVKLTSENLSAHTEKIGTKINLTAE